MCVCMCPVRSNKQTGGSYVCLHVPGPCMCVVVLCTAVVISHLHIALGHTLSVSSAGVSHVGWDMRFVAERATLLLAAPAFCCVPTGTTTDRVCTIRCLWTRCCRRLGCPIGPKALPAVVTFAVHRGPTGAGPCSTAAVAAPTPSCASACLSTTLGPTRALGRALSHVRTWRRLPAKPIMARPQWNHTCWWGFAHCCLWHAGCAGYPSHTSWSDTDPRWGFAHCCLWHAWLCSQTCCCRRDRRWSLRVCLPPNLQMQAPQCQPISMAPHTATQQKCPQPNWTHADTVRSGPGWVDRHSDSVAIA